MAVVRNAGFIMLLVLFTAAQSAAYQQVELVRELGAKEKDKKPVQARLTGPRAIAVRGDLYYVADTDAHRIVVMDREGKAVRTWGSKGGKPGQFKAPAGIALDEQGQVYVSDTDNNRVQVFDAEGTWIAGFGTKGSGAREFDGPRGIRASHGLLYIADSGNGRVQVLTYSGIAVQRINYDNGKESLKAPADVALDAQNRIYVVDADNHNVRIFDRSGVAVGVFGVKGKGNEGFSKPQGIAVDSRGSVYVSDTGNCKLKKFDLQGRLLGSLGNEGKGPGQFLAAAGIVIDAEQKVAVVDAGKNSLQLFAWEIGDIKPMPPASPLPTVDLAKVFPGEVSALAVSSDGLWSISEDYLVAPGAAGGKKIAGRGKEQGFLRNARGLAVDANGAFWVADTGNDRVQKFNHDGSVVLTIGGSGSGEGEFRSPSGIAVSPAGRVYVADTKNKRVQVFNAQGIFLGSFGKAGKLAGQFNEPVDLSLDRSENVFVVDRGNERIAKFDSNGVLQWEAGSSGRAAGQFREPENIAVSPDGEIFVLDAGNARIQVFDSRGAYLRQFGSEGREPGEFKSPSGMVLLDSMHLAVGDHDNRRVQMFVIRNTPAVPAGDTAKPGVNEVQVSWKPNTESYLEHYRVYRADSPDGDFKLITTVAEPQYVDTGLPSNRAFSYRISSKAREGFESSLSTGITATTPRLMPAPPQDVTIAAGQKKLSLAWAPNAEPYFASYRIYRSAKEVNGFELLATTEKPEYVDNAVADETRYSYRVTAVGREGDESPAGPVVSQTTPKAAVTVPPVEIAAAGLGDVFSSAYKYYESHAIGKVTLVNNTDKAFTAVKVSFTIKQFMDFPTEQVIELPAKQRMELPLKPVFNNKILEVTENTPIQTEIAVTYFENEEPRIVTRSVPLTLYERHALVWDRKEKLGAFVTPKDPPVMEFTRAAILPYVDTWQSIPAPLVYARAVYDALGVAGLTYIVDPASPFAKFSEQTTAVDYLEYPRDTLSRKSGDCDDLSALFAACMENIGIGTAFVDVPGHVFVMFNTGVTDQDRLSLGFPEELLASHEGFVWIPVEMTMVGSSFTRAWQKGAEEYRDWSAKGKAEVIVVQKAWEEFKPVTLPAAETKTPGVSREAIEKKFKDELDVMAHQRLDMLSKSLLEALKQKPNDLLLLGQLGLLYGENGFYAEAADQFKKMLAVDAKNAVAFNNLGNLSLLQGKTAEAITAYESALRNDPSDPGIMVNMSRALLAEGKKEKAKIMLIDAAAIDPRVLRTYDDLAAGLGVVK